MKRRPYSGGPFMIKGSEDICLRHLGLVERWHASADWDTAHERHQCQSHSRMAFPAQAGGGADKAARARQARERAAYGALAAQCKGRAECMQQVWQLCGGRTDCGQWRHHRHPGGPPGLRASEQPGFRI